MNPGRAGTLHLWDRCNTQPRRAPMPHPSRWGCDRMVPKFPAQRADKMSQVVVRPCGRAFMGDVRRPSTTDAPARPAATGRTLLRAIAVLGLVLGGLLLVAGLPRGVDTPISGDRPVSLRAPAAMASSDAVRAPDGVVASTVAETDAWADDVVVCRCAAARSCFACRGPGRGSIRAGAPSPRHGTRTLRTGRPGTPESRRRGRSAPACRGIAKMSCQSRTTPSHGTRRDPFRGQPWPVDPVSRATDTHRTAATRTAFPEMRFAGATRP